MHSEPRSSFNSDTNWLVQRKKNPTVKIGTIAIGANRSKQYYNNMETQHTQMKMVSWTDVWLDMTTNRNRSDHTHRLGRDYCPNLLRLIRARFSSGLEVCQGFVMLLSPTQKTVSGACDGFGWCVCVRARKSV